MWYNVDFIFFFWIADPILSYPSRFPKHAKIHKSMASANPFVRVGVGVIVKDPANPQNIFCGIRKGSHGAGMLALPGGHLEMMESWEDCASRECWRNVTCILKHQYSAMLPMILCLTKANIMWQSSWWLSAKRPIRRKSPKTWNRTSAKVGSLIPGSSWGIYKKRGNCSDH